MYSTNNVYMCTLLVYTLRAVCVAELLRMGQGYIGPGNSKPCKTCTIYVLHQAFLCVQVLPYSVLTAVAGNHKECVELLLQKRADVNCTQWNGWSSLHEAAYQGFADILCILLKSGAKTDVKDDYGIAPVFTAAQYGHLDCLKLQSNMVRRLVKTSRAFLR